jgi:acyl-CoA thioesterase-1
MLAALREAFPKARIIGITAVWGSDRAPATMERVNEIVRKSVIAVDGTFIDIGFPLVGHTAWLQPDQIHPNASGQQEVAKTIEEKLATLNLAL